MSWMTADTRAELKRTHGSRLRYRRWHRAYHADTSAFLQQLLPADSTVLVIGNNVTELCAGLRARKVACLELDPEENSTAGEARPVATLAEAANEGPFDFIFLPFSLQIMENIQRFFEELHPVLSPDSRVVSLQYNFFWAPFIRAAERLRLKSPMPVMNWLNRQDLFNLLELAGYQPVTHGARCLIPFHWFGLGPALNRWFAQLPGLGWACQKTFVVARAAQARREPRTEGSFTVVVPARNEAGNIAACLDRLPVLGSRCELIFVEGNSADDTWGEINRQMKAHPRANLFSIQALQQKGRGKADAVRLGFANATGDFLIILDADLTVQPEDLVLFERPLALDRAEVLNGSRLVYQMEKHAMQVLNLFFNKAFAWLLSWIIGQPVKDTLCGTKALSRHHYERIRRHFADLSELDPFGDFEILLGASQLHLKILDVPVRYKSRSYGSTNISRFRNGWELLRLSVVGWLRLRR